MAEGSAPQRAQQKISIAAPPKKQDNHRPKSDLRDDRNSRHPDFSNMKMMTKKNRQEGWRWRYKLQKIFGVLKCQFFSIATVGWNWRKRSRICFSPMLSLCHNVKPKQSFPLALKCFFLRLEFLVFILAEKSVNGGILDEGQIHGEFYSWQL